MKTFKECLLCARHDALSHLSLKTSVSGSFRGRLNISEDKPFARGPPRFILLGLAAGPCIPHQPSLSLAPPIARICIGSRDPELAQNNSAVLQVSLLTVLTVPEPAQTLLPGSPP